MSNKLPGPSIHRRYLKTRTDRLLIHLHTNFENPYKLNLRVFVNFNILDTDSVYTNTRT